MNDPIFREAPPLDRFDQVLVDMVSDTGMSVEQLPYSEPFDAIVNELHRLGDRRTHRQVYRRLLALRNGRWLPYSA